MKANSFDDETCKELTGDDRSRKLEGKARKDAESGNYSPPDVDVTGSYWNQASSTMELYVYIAAYKKRLARLERIKLENKSTQPRVNDIRV